MYDMGKEKTSTVIRIEIDTGRMTLTMMLMRLHPTIKTWSSISRLIDLKKPICCYPLNYRIKFLIHKFSYGISA